jgi:hypothetical protein
LQEIGNAVSFFGGDVKEKRTKTVPSARKDGLVVQELPDEVLVYDSERHKAHCLNPTAALVWKHCDGRRSVAEMARLLEKSLGTGAVSEDVVRFALNQLERDHLLEEKLMWPTGAKPISRRELVRRLGIGAAVAIPLITSILAPSVAYAGSGANPGATCTSNSDCSGGLTCQNIINGTGTCL